jgi:hypothetical protein
MAVALADFINMGQNRFFDTIAHQDYVDITHAGTSRIVGCIRSAPTAAALERAFDPHRP